MAYPPAYTRTYSFTDWETTHPGEPKPGPQLDNEYDNVSNALTATQDALALIQRADGALANDSVGPDQIQDGLFDGIADDITDDAEAAADAAQASATAAAGSASAAAASAAAAAISDANAAGAAAQAGVSQGIAQNAANEADLSADDAEDFATNAANSANEAQGFRNEAEGFQELAFDWAEKLEGPVMPASPGWPEAVDDGMFSSKWWAIRAREYNSTDFIDLGDAGADVGEGFDIWDAIPGNDLGIGQTYATWGDPPNTYVLIDRSNPSDPESWENITGGPGPPNVLTVGSTTTLPPGSPASVTITGTSPAQVINFDIPQGAVGPQGPQGDPGPAGPPVNLASPTAQVGLTVVNGVAPTAMRSDAAPPLDQSISPVWSGTHRFNGPVNLAGPLLAQSLDGVSGQVLSSQGTGLPPIWRTPGGGSIELGWNFNSSTANANPGSQKMSFNASTYAATTAIYFNALAMTNFDANTILSLLRPGNRIYIQQRNDASKAVVYEVTNAGTNNTGWWTIPVSVVNSLGTMFPNNADLNAVFMLSTSAPTFANPTAQVGLAAVDGVATTAMRSDAAPALSQAIVPTWTGAHTFGATTTTLSNANGPILKIVDTNAATDAKGWRTRNNDGTYQLATENDSGSAVAEALNFQRTGTAITTMSFGNATNNPTFNFLGTGAVSIPGFLTAGALTTPSIFLTNNSAPLNQKIWFEGVNTSGVYNITPLTDAGSGSNSLLSATRSGTTISAVTFGNATHNPTYTFAGSGAATFNGAVSISTVASQPLILNSSNANGPFTTYQRSGTPFADIGNGGQMGAGYSLDALALVARTGNAVEFGQSAAKRMTISSAGAVTMTGACTAASFTASSARAIKRETGPVRRAADMLSRLRPLLYRLLAGDDSEQLGLIAEEVHEVCPQLSDGKTVAYDRLAILLLAAWQDERVAT